MQKPMTCRFLGTVTLAAICSFGVSGAGAEAGQDPTLDAVLARAAAYVAAYQRDFGGIIAHERYVQSLDGGRTQRMESELFVFSPQDDVRWLIFRDVIEVDGKPVEDRAQRLEELFRDTRDIPAQLELDLRAESARFNIGFIRRDLNVPTMALQLLADVDQSRLSLEKVGERGLGGIDTWEI